MFDATPVGWDAETWLMTANVSALRELTVLGCNGCVEIVCDRRNYVVIPDDVIVG
jgi:hypothetical protein